MKTAADSAVVPRRPHPLSWGLACMCLAVVVGCNGAQNSLCDDQGALTIDGTCDIRTTFCQEAVLAATECASGRSRFEGSVRIISEDEYVAELEATPEQGAESGSEGEETVTEVDPWDEALRLVGLLPPAATLTEARTESQAEAVAAYYSTMFRDITVIDRGDGFDGASAMTTLSHEYAHALQDADYGIDELRNRYSYDDDTLIALANLTEGEAELRATLAMAVLGGFDVRPRSLLGEFDWQFAYFRRSVVLEGSPYVAVKDRLHYGTGARYFAQAFVAGGLAAVDAVIDDPPLTSVRWMAGYEADQAGGDRWEEPLTCREFSAPEGYDFHHSDSLGAAMLFGLLTIEERPPLYDVATGWNLALEWRGDEFRIFTRAENDGVALLWQLRFSHADFAREFIAIARSREANWRFRRHGQEVRLFAATDPRILSRWREEATCMGQRETP